MTCRTCRFLELPVNKAGRLYAAPGRGYPCTVPIPDPVLPVSVLSAYNWRWPPGRTYMGPDQGEGCRLWEAREAGE